jgi:hypothetical protein
MESRAYLETEMRKVRPGPLVVVSHHAPHPAHFQMPNHDPLVEPDILTAAYCSDLTALMSPRPDDGRGALRPADLWIYGHTHESFDSVIGATRVVSNAKATVLGRHTSARGTIRASMRITSSKSEGARHARLRPPFETDRRYATCPLPRFRVSIHFHEKSGSILFRPVRFRQDSYRYSGGTLA